MPVSATNITEYVAIMFITAVQSIFMALDTGIKTVWQIDVANTRGSHINTSKTSSYPATF